MEPSARFRLETVVFFLAAIGFCSLATHSAWFRVFDLAVYDALINRFEAPLADDLLIVGIDEQSLATYGAWPWHRSDQAELLTRISEGNPKALLVDIVYAGETDPVSDQALTDAAASVSLLALPVLIDALATDRQLIEVLPYPDLLEVSDVLGHAHVELDSDAIARGVYLHQGIGDGHWPHIAYALATALGHPLERASRCPDAQEFTLQNQVCDFVYLPFAGPPGTVPEVSAADLLGGQVDPSYVAQKVVFLGITTAAAPDSITSPVSRFGRPMPGVEFNINLFNALIQNRLIQPASFTVLLPIALVCVILPVLLLPRLSPKAMLIAALSFSVIPLAIGAGGLILFQTELSLAAAMVTCLLCYPYWSWRRHEIAWGFIDTEMSRLAEERSRWAPLERESNQAAARSLAALLDAEPVWYQAAPALEHSRQIILSSATDGWLVLSRQKPFTESDRRFADRLHSVFDPPQTDNRLPGERLAAQIRKLQTTGLEVRLGREVGLRGLEEMPIGVAVISALNQVLLANAAWRALLDTRDKVEGWALSEIVKGIVPPLGQNWLEISRAVLLEKQTITFETQTAAGTPVVVEAGPLAETSEPAEPWVITITDVSDVRVAERDREEALTFLSHDLRSPMLSVLALVRSAPPDPLLEDIGRYAQKGLSVSEQFLQLSRVQARESFETYDVDLMTILDNSVDHVFHLARDKHVTVSIEDDEGDEEAAWLTGNGEMLERAFVNLLTNAIKYSQNGGRVSVGLVKSEDRYLVTVSDEGVGIPEDELERIFDPYFRSNEPRLAEQRGTGLGLRFVKTVLARHGGDISVRSRLNEGSRFTVTLPANPMLSE